MNPEVDVGHVRIAANDSFVVRRRAGLGEVRGADTVGSFPSGSTSMYFVWTYRTCASSVIWSISASQRSKALISTRWPTETTTFRSRRMRSTSSACFLNVYPLPFFSMRAKRSTSSSWS
jgi:hypothetical protein